MRPSRFWLAALLAWPAASTGQVRVAVISDLNGSYGSAEYEPSIAKAMAKIRELHPDVVLNAGDMVAGQRRQPVLTRPEVERMWDGFHRTVTSPLMAAGIPMAGSPGNHDASVYPAFVLERQIFREQWRSRRPQLNFVDESAYPFHYAFEMGGVLFVSMDGTGTGSFDPAQKMWLRQILAQHGGKVRWRVVFMHVPLFPFARGREHEVVTDSDLESILRGGKVDLLLTAHHQAYYAGVEDGMIWVGQACLGAGPRALRGEPRVSPRAFTFVTLPAAGAISVEAWEGPEYAGVVNLRSLPEKLVSPRRVLRRLDR